MQNRYIDYKIQIETKSIEKSSTKDMLFEVIMATLVSYVVAEALLFAALLLVLLFRPSGLFAEAIQRRT